MKIKKKYLIPVIMVAIISIIVVGFSLFYLFVIKSVNINYKGVSISKVENTKDVLSYYTNIVSLSDVTTVHVNARFSENSQELFKVDVMEGIYEKPVLKQSGQHLYLYFTGTYFNGFEVYLENGKLEELRGDCNAKIYRYNISTGELTDIPINNPKNNLILDMFDDNGTPIVLSEERTRSSFYGDWEESRGLINSKNQGFDKQIVGNAPLRIRAEMIDSTLLFPALDGVYKYDIQSGIKSKVIEKSLQQAGFAQILNYGREGYILVVQNMKSKSSHEVEKGLITIQKFDPDFTPISTSDFDLRIDNLCKGNTGMIISYLEKNNDKGYTIKSYYIPYETLIPVELKSLTIDYETYFKYYRDKDDNNRMDKDIFYNYLDFARGTYKTKSPVWSYGVRGNRFIMINPFSGEIINQFKENIQRVI